MIRIEVTANVTYTCDLSEKDSIKVKEKAKQLSFNDGGEIEDYYAEAVAQLYSEHQIDLYADSTESDFSTESFNSAEEIVDEKT